jgi:hypothetical protein
MVVAQHRMDFGGMNHSSHVTSKAFPHDLDLPHGTIRIRCYRDSELGHSIIDQNQEYDVVSLLLVCTVPYSITILYTDI